MDTKELRAKSLEIAVLIRGGSNDSPLQKYLSLANEIASYINTGPKDAEAQGGSVSSAPVKGV